MVSSVGLGSEIKRWLSFKMIKDFKIVILPKGVKILVDHCLSSFSICINFSLKFKFSILSRLQENCIPNIVKLF